MEAVFDLIHSCGDGAFAIDRKRRIVLWNDACAEIFGFTAVQVLKQPCYEVIGGRAEDGCLICGRHCMPQQGLANLQPVTSRDVCTRHRDGHTIWLNMSTVAVPSCWHDLSAVLHFVRDITVRKRIEQSVSELVRDVGRLAHSDEHSMSALKVHGPGADLTRREKQVLKVLGTGATTQEIADRLFISNAPTRNHIHRIISKLGVRNRLEAVTLAMRDGAL